jgi:DNA-binding winged helix-turn-helix (wHTH) protein
VFHKDELLRDVWGSARWVEHGPSTRTPAAFRRKLNLNGEAAYVVNVWGVGYRLVAAA